MIDELKKNIATEIEMLREISNYSIKLESATPVEKRLLENAITSLKQSIKIINRSVPIILNNISGAQKLPSTSKPNTNLQRVAYKGAASTLHMTVQTKDRDKLLNELSINEGLIKRLKKSRSIEEEKIEEFRAARGYLKFANKLFLRTSSRMVEKGYFRPLSLELKKANIDILLEAYVAMMLLTALISFLASIFIAIFLLVFNVGLSWPIISLYDGGYLIRLAYVIGIPLVLPCIVFFALYIYPTTEKNTIAKKIEQELPFAVIHMRAISGSGIEPTEIFKIIGLSKEYPHLRKEIRKVLNQINIYGYDLVTALTNVAKNTPSSKLAELFNGLVTTIHSGGELTEFFEKRSETLLMGYRLEREKFTHIAEMFMDIYISVVIAAPMILMLLLVMISVSGISMGISSGQITLIIVLIIALINIVFLGFLQVKQPAY
jgi:hypothetical protein